MTKLQKIILISMAAIIGLLLVSAACMVLFFKPPTVINPFVPPEFDPAAQIGTPAPGENTSYGTLNLTETTAVSLCANVYIENQSALVYFTSHKDNQGWMKIKLTDEAGNLLGESGLIRPGEYVRGVQLASVPKESGLILAKILIYEPDSYLSLGSAGAQVMLIIP